MDEVEERHEDTRLSSERAGARKIPLAVSPTSPVPGASQHDSSDADSDAERKKRKKTSKKKKKSKKSSKDKDHGSAGDDKSVEEDASDTGETDAKKSSKKKKKEKKEKSKKSSRKSKHSHDENEGDHEEDEEAAARRAARRETRKKKHSDKAGENSEDEEGHRSSKSSRKSKHKSKRRHGSSDNIDILADASENDDAHKQTNEDDRGIEEEYKNASDGEEDADASEKNHHHRRSHRHGDKKSHKSSDDSSSKKKKKKKKKKDKEKEKEKEKKDGSSKHSSKEHRSSSHLDNQEVAGADNGTHDAVEDNEIGSARDEGFGVRGQDDGFAALERVMSGLHAESKGAEDASDDAEGNRVLLEDDLEEHEFDAHDADRTDDDDDDASRYEDDEEEEENEDGDEDDENEAKSGGHKMDEENEHSAWNQSLPSEIRDDLYVDEFSDVQDASQEMSHRIRKLRKLLYGPVPEGVTLKAQIDRHYDHSGSVYYSFILPVERGDGMRDKRMTLMIAKCRTGVTLKPTYVISLEPIDFKKRCAQRSERYFGKVQLIKGSDALGLSGPMQYVVYDDGYNPSRVGGSRGEPPVGFSRKLLASVIYEDTKGIPEDLKMTVALPKMSHVPEDEVNPSMDPLKTQFKSLSRCHNFSIQERIMEDEEDLEHHPFLQAAEKTMLATHSIPMGNKKRLAISSESRFPVAPSIKNFEVCRAPTNASSTPELGLARIGKERFFALVRYPFSPFEAFGVCISKFDATSSYRSKLGRRMSL